MFIRIYRLVAAAALAALPLISALPAHAHLALYARAKRVRWVSAAGA
jgi:hypothetical protein